MIRLPYGGPGAQFDENDLVAYIMKTGRDYIIQGQQQFSLKDHTKPNSLDYWLRKNFAICPDTKQAVNDVMKQLVKTGLFEEVEKLKCPDSRRVCKGIRLKA